MVSCLPPLNQKNLILDILWISMNPSPKIWSTVSVSDSSAHSLPWPGVLLCSQGQSPAQGWNPASCHSTPFSLTMSPVLSAESSSASLPHQKIPVWSAIPPAHSEEGEQHRPYFTSISACHSKSSVRFFHLAFSHWNSEEFWKKPKKTKPKNPQSNLIHRNLTKIGHATALASSPEERIQKQQQKKKHGRCLSWCLMCCWKGFRSCCGESSENCSAEAKHFKMSFVFWNFSRWCHRTNSGKNRFP